MLKSFRIYSLLLFLALTFISNAQKLKVDYVLLQNNLFEEQYPTICILDDGNVNLKLFDNLVQKTDFKSKFTCYSKADLIQNKDILNTTDFNPEDENFLQALNDVLSINYLLYWEAIPDSDGVYQLSIYSTKNHKKIYSFIFYNSINSSPDVDVEKLLVENMKPVYSKAAGELEANVIPAEASLKLYKGNDLIEQWSGGEKKEFAPGKYKLVTSAEGYKVDNTEIEITSGERKTVNINLEKVFLMPAISAGDNLITNVKPENDGKEIKIYYDLVSTEGNKYNISISLTDNTTKKSFTLKNVAGDIEDVPPGKNKLITWSFNNEIGDEPLNHYELRLSTEKNSGGIAWYIYAAGGTLVAVAILIINPPPPDPDTKVELGNPPTRPTGN